MTSVLRVLLLALVCSIFGKASEERVDDGGRRTGSITHSIITNYKFHHYENDNHNQAMKIKNTRTNNHVTLIDNSILNNKLKENNNFEIENDRKTIINDFYIENNKDKLKNSIKLDNLKEQMDNLVKHREYFEKTREDTNKIIGPSLDPNPKRSTIITKHGEIGNSKATKASDLTRVKRQETKEEYCDPFNMRHMQVSHPHPSGKSDLYSSSTDCVATINATEGSVVELTFVDMFHIEKHPACAYDYLEIRDGVYGFAHLLGKLCGDAFPSQIRSTGPSVWLKFHSDETIEYEGFHINVEFMQSPNSHSIPSSCYYVLTGTDGVVDSSTIDADCRTRSASQALDVLWKIETKPNTKIHLNFTQYALAKPNECEDNVVQIFGSELEYDARLAYYCGSMANSITTKGGEPGKPDQGNIMYVRLYASKSAKTSAFSATFTAFRSLDPNKNDDGCTENEFDCEDNTCIASNLKCNGYANCRLKADEDHDRCKQETESVITQPHIMVILIIFSLIISGMSFVFLFKCIRKLYQDHKIIKEHIRQSCEDRLDNLGSRLHLDPSRLRMDSEPRASLERENHANEMFKKNRGFTQQQTSLDSDIQETQIELDDESWRHDVEHTIIEEEEHRPERNGRPRQSDLSKKEQSMRRESKGRKEKKEVPRSNSEKESLKEKKEIKDASVGAPDTKESSCQTRESLFQAGAPSSDGSGSGSGSRGFSTFGYSGATIVRPSPPTPQIATSEITIELLRSVPPQPNLSKKLQDRRPMSSETTRSAPDVIIVSKPIR